MMDLGIFAGTPVASGPPLPVGTFRMIGMATVWEEVVGGEDLLGIAPSFDFENEVIDTIYQRYNIYDPVEAADVPDVDLVAAITTKLTALGYTVTEPPTFGDQTDSYYLLYPED